jgi:hypothetical protein
MSLDSLAPSSPGKGAGAPDPQPPARRRSGSAWIERCAIAAVVLVFLVGGALSTLKPALQGLGHNQQQALWQATPVQGAVPDPSRLSPPAAAPSGSGAPSKGSALRSPSGVAMPVGDLPGWHQVLAEDFGGNALDRGRWDVYDGQPGGDPAGWWNPSHVLVGNDMLTIRGSQDQTPNGRSYVTGGISNAPSFSQSYGRFDIRFRMDKGLGIAYALLLWPTSNVWPPEIDIMEDNGHYRSDTSATLHYGADNHMVFRKVAGDFTKWHTAGLEWTPGKLVYYLDGKVWTTMSGSYIPKEPMHIAIQTQAWPCGGTWEACPDATTPAAVDLQVDWVTAYSWTGR